MLREEKVRIGIDATCLPSALAGAGRYIHGVVRGLACVDDHNEYFIFTKTQDTGQFARLPDNMQLVPLPNFTRPLRMAWQHFIAAQHARRLKLEVWHGMHYTLPAFARQLTTVATFHDMGVLRFPHFYSWSKRVYFRQALTRSLHAARHIVAVSEATGGEVKAWLAQQKNGSSAQPAVAAIPSGVEEKFFEPAAQEEITRLRQAYHLTAPYLLFVGTFEKRKNLNTLLQAFHLLRQRGYDDHLLALAGLPDNGSAEVQANIEKLGLQAHVRLPGYVPEENLPALYQGAALFALPSYYEGFGFPLLEAMAGGVVALAANNSSLIELAAHPSLLCDETPVAWADKIEQLLCDQKLRREMRTYGRARAREFSWQKTAERLREIYESHAPSTPSAPRNGKARGAEKTLSFLSSNRQNLTQTAPATALQRAVRQTLAYADLFDYPLTLPEIHYGLFGVSASFAEVRQAVLAMRNNGEITEKESYHYFNGRAAVVNLRQHRAVISGELLKKNRRWLGLVQSFPFVRCVALSGALAFQNCKRDDDLDLFLVVEKGRLWTVYAGLVALLKFFGKRRRLCLNCLIDTEQMRFADQDLFVAHQIAFLQPLSGAECFRQFFQANVWCGRYLPQIDAEARLPATAPAEDLRRSRLKWRQLVENFFRGPRLDRLENFIYHRYRNRIARLTRHLLPQAVSAERGQIKLFTNNHRFHLQYKLAARVEELEAQPFCLEQNGREGFVEV